MINLISFFLNFFMKNHLLTSPYLVKRRQFCQNYTIFWVKKVNRYPAFPIFHGKITVLLPIFIKKRPFSKKHRYSHVHISSKNVHSHKNTFFSYHFFEFSMKNLRLPCPSLDFCKNYIISFFPDFSHKLLP